MALIPKNETARIVLDHLPCSYSPCGGYFGGQSYCIGVRVRDVGEAFELGKSMGAEATSFGTIGHAKLGNQILVVFREAFVSQGLA